MKFFSKISLRARLMSTIIISAIGFGASCYISIHSLQRLGSMLDESYSTIVPNSITLGQMGIARGQIGMYLWALTRITDDPEQRKGFQDLIREMLVRYTEAAKTYQNADKLPGEAELFKPTADLNEEFIALSTELANRLEKNSPLENEYVYQSIKSGKWRNTGRNMRKGLEAVIAFYGKEAKEKDILQETTRKAAMNQTILVAALSVLATSILLFILSLKISQSLALIAQKLKDSGERLVTSSVNLSASSHQLSSSVSQQAASIQETSAAIEEISSMAARTRDNAGTSMKVSGQANTDAQTGQSVVERMIGSMDNIKATMQTITGEIVRSNKDISGIADVIRAIDSKTKVINEIVFQTNLLSFNASVEAARAGEQGKGFAVVAEEVRNLAMMSGKAAEDISKTIALSISRVETVISESNANIKRVMSENENSVQEGTRVAQECSRALSQIVSAAGEMTGLVSDIATATSEQTNGVSEIQKAIQQLDQATQESANVATASSAASTEISNNASALNEVADELLEVIQGRAA